MFKRLGHNQQSPDFFLLDLCSKQDSTLKEVFPKLQPAPSPSREQPKSPVSEEGGDSGVHSKVGAHSPTGEVDIHPSQDDLAMLGNASGGADNNLSHSSQEGDSTDPDSQRTRIVVESVDGPAGKKRATNLNENDLIQFKIRLDKHIEEWNDSLDVDNDEDLICIMPPVIEKGKIIIHPQGMTVGNHIIKMVNAKVRMASHHIKAGRNIDLPLMATVSVRYESVTDKDPRVMIEDPKKGLARLNKWKLEGREIAYRRVSPDPKNPHVFFASVRISKWICSLIQGQQGKVWIHGGQASFH